MQLDDETSIEPVGAWHDSLIVKRRLGVRPGVFGNQEFELLNPFTMATEPLWSVPAEQQDLIWGQDDGWVATTRQGFSLPFERWMLILHNLATGESREIARDEPAVLRTDGLDPVLPSGFAPTPSISAGRVVWVETALDPATNVPYHRVREYDIATGTTETLVRNEDATHQRIYFPAIGGRYLAWAYWESRESPFQIFVQDLESGETQEIENPGQVFDVRLSEDGRFLAWSNPEDVFVQDLTTGERTAIAHGHLGVDFDGDYVYWAPSVADGRPRDGGSFNVKTGESVAVIEPAQHRMNIARALGPWFVWQDIPPEGLVEAKWYLVKLS